MTLKALIAKAGALKVSEQQATDIESPGNGVLLSIESATPAKNVAIMRSIVEVIKRVSPMGEVEHVKKETGSKGVKTSGPLKPLGRWTKSQSHVYRR